jgi:PTH1 family peptidyl-tRNA hydrolase
MNRSGRAALALLRRYDESPAALLVIHDDADLELGRLRIRPTGRAGGHNGLRSLIASLGSEEFPRIKLGVRGEGRGEADLADYVLEEFAPQERTTASALVMLGADAVEAVLGGGLEPAMNLMNGRGVDASRPE